MNNLYYLIRPVTISTLSGLPAITPIAPISRISGVDPADEELTSQLQQNPVINQLLIYQGLKEEARIKRSEPMQAAPLISEAQTISQSQSKPQQSIEPVSPEPDPLPLYNKEGESHNAATNPPQRLSIQV